MHDNSSTAAERSTEARFRRGYADHAAQASAAGTSPAQSVRPWPVRRSSSRTPSPFHVNLRRVTNVPARPLRLQGHLGQRARPLRCEIIAACSSLRTPSHRSGLDGKRVGVCATRRRSITSRQHRDRALRPTRGRRLAAIFGPSMASGPTCRRTYRDQAGRDDPAGARYFALQRHASRPARSPRADALVIRPCRTSAPGSTHKSIRWRTA